jgi:uncharacterized protein (DUF2147 family)
MNKSMILMASLLLAAPAGAAAQSLEGLWANPHKSVIVKVDRCGPAFCGAVSWASDRNKEKGVALGTRVLSDLKPQGDGTYRGSAIEPKRNIRGSATVRQLGPNVMVVKGCALLGLLCREQRWTRVTS